MDSDTSLKRTVSFVPPRTTYSSLAIFKMRNGESENRGTGNLKIEELGNRGMGRGNPLGAKICMNISFQLLLYIMKVKSQEDQ